MAVQILNHTTVRCCKMLLLFLFLDSVAAASSTGSEAPMYADINERNKLDSSALGDTTTLLPVDNYNNENNIAGIDKDRHNLPFNIGNSLRSLNIVKRTPNGFIGMRGKKEYEFTDYSNANNPALNGDGTADWNIEPLQQAAYENEQNTAYDRVLAMEPRFKKAPSTFYGVRGKKYADSDFSRIDSLLQHLEEEHLREALIEDFINNLLNRKVLPANDVTKRAPIGFTGVRGKRPAAGVLDYLYNDEDGTLPLPMLDAKRGPVNAFVGVRGKKDVDHQAFKRSPVDSVNRRGKSQRFVDFGNKFVAVRGKKSNLNGGDSSTFSDDTNQRYYMNNMSLMPLLGVRGKRAVNAMPAEAEDATYELAVNDDN
ncbi:tachykinins [Rhagoletis pomonella]|uniref:tachykinins n=1 Tax=Rhagoletis pomonella TaxID=28610 RepID=UPI00177D09B9|nr:tachykinins [Rhagoletis pomonella]